MPGDRIAGCWRCVSCSDDREKRRLAWEPEMTHEDLEIGHTINETKNQKALLECLNSVPRCKVALRVPEDE